MAGFTWTQTIANNGIIEAQDINEIRANTDWLNNNRNYCSTHYISYCGSNLSHCGSNFSGGV